MRLEKNISESYNEVIKIGGSVLKTYEHYTQIAKKIKAYVKTNSFQTLYVVVSARKGRTDQLINDLLICREERKYIDDILNNEITRSEFKQVFDNPFVASYLLQGEINSAKRLSSKLKEVGIDTALLLQGSEFPIVANSSYLYASIDNINSMQRFNNNMPKNKVIVISGFGAENINGEKVLLGKNASDLVAALIGFFDRAVRKVIYLKDVDGIYSAFSTDKQKIIPEIGKYDLLKNDFGEVLDKRTLYYQKCDYLVQNENKKFGSSGTIIRNI